MKNKLKINSMLNLVISCIIFVLEVMPDSVKIAWSNGESKAPRIEYVSYLMDPNMLLWGIAFLTYFIALTTMFLIIFNAVVLYEENTKLTIMSLVGSALCLVGSVILVALKREYVTIHNLLIMLLFLAQVIIFSVKLRISAKGKKLGNDIKE